MAVKKNTLPKYTRNFNNLGDEQAKFLLKNWDRQTLFSLEKSNDLAPVAAGELVGSGSTKKAQITSRGIFSSIIYKIPYAKRLNEAKSDADWKEPGELSYYASGVKVFKAVKGVKGFLTKATTFESSVNRNRFRNIVQKSVSKAFLSV